MKSRMTREFVEYDNSVLMFGCDTINCRKREVLPKSFESIYIKVIIWNRERECDVKNKIIWRKY
jgi:hypothetical protein